MVREFIVVVSNLTGMTRKFVGIASTVIGLVCYALSASLHSLMGKWNPLKMSLYIMFSYIICLAIIFPKAWEHWRIFKYKAHFTFLILASTTVYSFYLDSKLKTKPDAYSIISSAAFAVASLCISKQIECGFLDLTHFFCEVLMLQLMQVNVFFVLVGITFTGFLVITRSNLDNLPDEPGSRRSRGDHPGQVSGSRHASGATDALPPPRSSHVGDGGGNYMATVGFNNSYRFLKSIPRMSPYRCHSFRSQPIELSLVKQRREAGRRAT